MNNLTPGCTQCRSFRAEVTDSEENLRNLARLAARRGATPRRVQLIADAKDRQADQRDVLARHMEEVHP